MADTEKTIKEITERIEKVETELRDLFEILQDEIKTLLDDCRT